MSNLEILQLMMREVIYVYSPKKVLYDIPVPVLLKRSGRGPIAVSVGFNHIRTVAGDLSFPQSTGEEFMVDFCQCALPFLKRVEKLHKGERKKLLEGYIKTVAKVSTYKHSCLFIDALFGRDA